MTATDQAAAIARYGLASDDAISVTGERAAALVNELQRERVLGVAVRAVSDRWLDVGSATDTLNTLHQVAMAQVLRLEVLTLDVVHRLDQVGITSRLLKGGALAHTCAVDPSDREFRDVDLLVPGHLIDQAVRVVEVLGGERLHAPLRPGFDARFGKSVTMRLDGLEIDLHRTLAPGPFGIQMNPSELFVVPNQLVLAGRSVSTLDTSDHLVHACYHAALGQQRPVLANLRDIVMLSRTSWDRSRVADSVKRWAGRPVMARSIGHVREHLGIELGELSALFPVESADLALLAPYDKPGDRFAGLAKATLRVLSPADRVAFALAVGLPHGTNPTERVQDLVRRRRWRST